MFCSSNKFFGRSFDDGIIVAWSHRTKSAQPKTHWHSRWELNFIFRYFDTDLSFSVTILCQRSGGPLCLVLDWKLRILRSFLKTLLHILFAYPQTRFWECKDPETIRKKLIWNSNMILKLRSLPLRQLSSCGPQRGWLSFYRTTRSLNWKPFKSDPRI